MLAPLPSHRAVRLALVAALVLGTALRAIPVLAAPLPLGDGGLFLAMIDDLRASGLTLAASTSYNGLDIPFLYPPAALMLAAGLGQLLGAATTDLLRFIPLIASVACLAAFMVLARRLLAPAAAAGAALAYAVMPHAFDWVIAGGGLTRGLGLLAALGAMAIAVHPAPSIRRGGLIGALLGASALAHPQAVVLGAIGATVLAVPGPRLRQAWITQTMVAAGVTVLVTATWLVPATLALGQLPLGVASHRLDPFNGLVRLAALEFSGAAFMDLVTPLAVVGLVVGLLVGPRRLALLLVLVYASGPGGGDFLGAVPWALLAGIGVGGVVHVVDRHGAPFGALLGTATAALLFAAFSTLGSSIHEGSKLQAISVDQAAAMRWVADAMPADTPFVVATIDTWGNDEVSEWFPAIAGRPSIGTVQGSEWLGREAFERREDVHLALVGCIGATAHCYRDVAKAVGEPEAAIFVPKGRLAGPFSALDCCPALRSTLEGAGYQIVYDGPGATIAQRGG
ncbi:MAG: hypothetical protein K5924_12540 [Chloroflexi bacterium]|nr:hypothetical protein [Chloroflexota bacterium]